MEITTNLQQAIEFKYSLAYPIPQQGADTYSNRDICYIQRSAFEKGALSVAANPKDYGIATAWVNGKIRMPQITGVVNCHLIKKESAIRVNGVALIENGILLYIRFLNNSSIECGEVDLEEFYWLEESAVLPLLQIKEVLAMLRNNMYRCLDENRELDFHYHILKVEETLALLVK